MVKYLGLHVCIKISHEKDFELQWMFFPMKKGHSWGGFLRYIDSVPSIKLHCKYSTTPLKPWKNGSYIFHENQHKKHCRFKLRFLPTKWWLLFVENSCEIPTHFPELKFSQTFHLLSRFVKEWKSHAALKISVVLPFEVPLSSLPMKPW
jgi:hypothetical protein